MNTQTPFLLYKNSNNEIKVDVLLKDETLWLNQKQIAELFAVDRSVITKHLKNIIDEGELYSSTCVKIAQVRQEGTREVKRNIEKVEAEIREVLNSKLPKSYDRELFTLKI